MKISHFTCFNLFGCFGTFRLASARCDSIVSSNVLDTVIVGAGGSGMFAGYTLRRNGFDNFKILEASSMVGGRVRDLPDSFIGSDLDLNQGAAFAFNGLDGLREVLDLSASEQWTIDSVLFNPVDSSQRCTLGENGGVSCSPEGPEQPFVEDVFEDSTYFGYFEKYVIPYVTDKIELNTLVTGVDYTDDGSNLVKVCTSTGESYHARNVVIAVPLSVMKSDVIEFTPALPSSYTNTINSIEQTGGVRFWVEFSEKFYPDGLWVDREEDNDFQYYLDATFGQQTNRNIITNPGISETSIGELSEQQLVDTILSDLDKIYNGMASATYMKHYIQNWDTEPLIEGLFSQNDELTESDFMLLSTPINGKIYLAGEYTIEGRFFPQSGKSAAEKIIDMGLPTPTEAPITDPPVLPRPTEAPNTEAPVSLPPTGEVCFNRELSFKNRDKKDCDWVGKKKRRRCRKEWEGQELWEYCPKACRVDCFNCCDINLHECFGKVCGPVFDECAAVCEEEAEDFDECIYDCRAKVEECYEYDGNECWTAYESCDAICEEEDSMDKTLTRLTRLDFKDANVAANVGEASSCGNIAQMLVEMTVSIALILTFMNA